jgi:O-antigen ligase
LLVLAVAAGLGPLALALAGVAAAALWSVHDIRVAYLIAVLLASFVNTAGGHLMLQLAAVYGWLAWCAILTLWRAGWQPVKLPPRPVLVALAVWTAACVFGVVLGFLRGNSPRYLGLEFMGSAWPVLALLVCQVQDRRTLMAAGAGLVLISLVHTVFGITWLEILRQRIGGVYFTTVPGFTAVGLWAVAILAPQARVRRGANALLVPLVVHQFLSFTRGYWLGILAGLAVATGLAWWEAGRARRWESLRRARVLLGSMAVVIAAVALSARLFGQGALLEGASNRLKSSFSVQASAETGSNIMRLLEYSVAIDAARQSPILGRGFGFLIHGRDPFTGKRFLEGVIHNLYVFLWLKLGIVGLAAFGFLMWRFLASALRYERSEPDWLPRAWGVAAIAMTVQGLVICLTNYSLIDFCTGIYLAYVWGTACALMATAAPRSAGNA